MTYGNADLWNPHQFDYFRQGYSALELSRFPGFDSIQEELTRIEGDEIRSDENWEYKAPKYAIFRSPGTYLKFARWFVESGLQKEIFDITGALPILGSISVIRHEEGIRLNTPWHRDTWVSGRKSAEKLVGLVHPAIKLYFYPCFESEPRPRSQFLPGSHRWGSRSMGLERIKGFLYGKTAWSSRGTGVLFDTSTMHRVCPEGSGQRSLRLVFQLYAHPQALFRFPLDQAVQAVSLEGIRAFLGEGARLETKMESPIKR